MLGHCDISITASTYAHLDIEQVRRELGITTAALLGLEGETGQKQESRVERLVREIGELSPEERRELKGWLFCLEQ
ncbi:MAG: hypothetical protein WStaPseu_18300 [Shewanella algae]